LSPTIHKVSAGNTPTGTTAMITKEERTRTTVVSDQDDKAAWTEQLKMKQGKEEREK